MSSSPVTYVGKYRLINAVYSGQVSRTWQAYDDENRKSVAVKILFQSATGNKDQIAFFKWEYGIGSQFNDPLIIKFYEFGWYGKAPYIAMEWFPTPNVKQLLLKKYSLYCVCLPTLLPQMAQALATFNDAGYVHCDVKPDNYLFSPDLGIKLIDFALAKKKGGFLSKFMPKRSTLQGTASYMSPEQIHGQVTSCVSDVYSLGCTFFEILSERLPFTGISMNDLLQKHLTGAIPSITARNKNITPEFSSLLSHMMAKKPADRIKTTREVANALKTIRIFKREPAFGDEVF